MTPMERSFLLPVLIVHGLFWCAASDITVSTNVGNITGSIEDVSVGPNIVRISTYLGIPFAEPPVAKLRFAKPVPKAKFADTFLANKGYAASCLQFAPYMHLKIQNEDCLYLNVFSPKIFENDKKYAVIVWVHGGGFVAGSGSTRTNAILAAYGQVVLVTLNYRLGPFGFLDTGGNDGSPNNGLWDQHLGIQWVKNNIGSFGGDSTNITIAGQSAGSAAVMFQAIYPGNEGLFQRVIAESGSVNAPWVIVTDPSEKLRTFTSLMNCPTTSIEGVSCLKALDARAIAQKGAVSFTPGVPQWGPAIDDDFLTENRLQALNLPIGKIILPHFKKLDLLMGTARFDGVVMLSSGPLYAAKSTDELKKALDQLLTRRLGLLFGQNISRAIHDDVLFQYENFEDPLNRDVYFRKAVDFATDIAFFVATYSALENHAYNNKISKTYQYEFNQQNPLGQYETWVTGAKHSDDLEYVFGSIYETCQKLNKTIQAEQWTFAKSMMSYWTNFAKTGNPNKAVSTTSDVFWETYDSQTKKYIYLQSGEIQMRNNLNRRRTEFWTNYLPGLIKRYSALNHITNTGIHKTHIGAGILIGR